MPLPSLAMTVPACSPRVARSFTLSEETRNGKLHFIILCQTKNKHDTAQGRPVSALSWGGNVYFGLNQDP